eukprot:5026476-Prymnesium_polylepis.1
MLRVDETPTYSSDSESYETTRTECERGRRHDKQRGGAARAARGDTRRDELDAFVTLGTSLHGDPPRCHMKMVLVAFSMG